MITLALISYIFVMSVTPGPNNLLLASSGVNFGFKRTLPMSLGISLGSGVQCFIALETFSFLMQWVEVIRLPIALLGCLYLLWLSWMLYKASTPDKAVRAQPLTFWHMFFFQWVNPKAWLMAINVAVLFGATEGNILLSNVLIAVVSSVVNYPCITLWAILGDRLRQVLQRPRSLSIFNTVMAVMMAVTAIWLLADEVTAEAINLF
ncbi:MAG: LysE family translocator [Pseudomonas sp.]|jgi:threonine/homoserine/homoserine lactone efflux protein|nr:LysE family translocator [Pseudomonas sp.]